MSFYFKQEKFHFKLRYLLLVQDTCWKMSLLTASINRNLFKSVSEIVLQAHLAIAACEKRLKSQGRKVVVITQNIDELHKRAGSENIYELHGNLELSKTEKLVRKQIRTSCMSYFSI